MADIFISYSQKDLGRVQRLAEALAEALKMRGWSVWWDRVIPAGQTFDQAIAAALGSARCVVVVWSKESVGSSWVLEEAEEGRRRGILIPVLIDEARPPLGFGRLQAVDLRDWNGLETAAPFRKLVTDITSILDRPPVPDRSDAVSPAAEPRRTAETVPAAADGAPPRLPRLPRQSMGRWLAALVVALVVLAVAALVLYPLVTHDAPARRPGPVTAASGATALRLIAVLKDGGDAIANGVKYEVYEAATDVEGNRKRVRSSPEDQGPPRFTLPGGRYYVAAAYGSASAGTEVKIAAGEIKPQILNLQAGILAVSSRLAPGSPALDTGVKYDVYGAARDVEGNRKHIVGSQDFQGPPRFPLPAGHYYVTAAYGSAAASTNVDIVAGQVEPTILNLHAGILALSSRLATGSPMLDTGVKYDVYEAARDVEGNRKRVVGSQDFQGPPRFPLPAGRYYVSAEYGSASTGNEIGIAAGEIKPETLTLQAGILVLSSVPASGGAPLASGVRYDVYEAARDVEGNRKRVVGSQDFQGPPRFPLPAGRYYVTAASPAGRDAIDTTLGPGEVRPIRLQLGQAKRP